MSYLFQLVFAELSVNAFTCFDIQKRRTYRLFQNHCLKTEMDVRFFHTHKRNFSICNKCCLQQKLKKSEQFPEILCNTIFRSMCYRRSVNEVEYPPSERRGFIYKSAWGYLKISNGNIRWTPPFQMGGSTSFTDLQ